MDLVRFVSAIGGLRQIRNLEPTSVARTRGSQLRQLGNARPNSGSSAPARAPRAPRPRSAAADGLDEALVNQSTHLSELVINDFGLVSEERVVFRPGLNVITGKPAAAAGEDNAD